MNHGCNALAGTLISALEEGRSGAVRDAASSHVAHCTSCRERAGAIVAMAEGLDPPIPALGPGFVARVMAEIQEHDAPPAPAGAYDRLPPFWQLGGAMALLVALSAMVLASPSGDGGWHARALTGFLDRALSFLAAVGEGVRGLWDTALPGQGLAILAGLALVATLLNVAFAVSAFRRRGREKTVE